MLTTNQIADLDAATQDINNKKIILETAIDVQALLRLLVEKNIVSRDEINTYRAEVRESPKWHTALMYVDQALEEIKVYQCNPQLRLKAMMAQKMKQK